MQLCLPLVLVWTLSKPKGFAAFRVKESDTNSLSCLQKVWQDELIGQPVKGNELVVEDIGSLTAMTLQDMVLLILQQSLAYMR